MHTEVYSLVTQHQRCWPEIIPSLPCPYFHIFTATVKVGMDVMDCMGTTLHRCDKCVQECMIVKVKLVSKSEPTAVCLPCISSAAWLQISWENHWSASTIHNLGLLCIPYCCPFISKCIEPTEVHWLYTHFSCLAAFCKWIYFLKEPAEPTIVHQPHIPSAS